MTETERITVAQAREDILTPWSVGSQRRLRAFFDQCYADERERDAQDRVRCTIESPTPGLRCDLRAGHAGACAVWLDNAMLWASSVPVRERALLRAQARCWQLFSAAHGDAHIRWQHDEQRREFEDAVRALERAKEPTP